MQRSTYLARLIGPPLAIVGAAMLLHPGVYLAAAVEFLKSPALLYLAAALGLLGGVALVLAHNVWAADWRIIITLLGWISIVDSASWLLLADRYVALWAGMLTGNAVALIGGAIVLLLGAILCYFGYAAARRMGD
jgi:hypothetical protein